MRGSLFLIPTYLHEDNTSDFIAPAVHDVLKNVNHYLVENVRTARRFISSQNLGIDISTLNFEQLDKRSTPSELSALCQPLLDGIDMGVMSEAGLPALADPGNLAVAWAHKNDIKVVPLPGTSSIQLALIASGFNGQQFSFHGYLPIDKTDRSKKIRSLESQMEQTGYTQVFMETPFRNEQLLNALTECLKPTTQLSISANISGKNELCKTKSIREWKADFPKLHKIPAVFCIGVRPA